MPSTSKPLFYKCLEKSWLNNRLWSDQKLMILSNLIKILAKQETSKATKVAAKSSLQELVVFSSFSWFVSKVRTYSNNRNSFRLKKAREMFQWRLEAFFFSIVTFHKNEIHGKICMKFSTFDSFGFSPTKCCCVEQFHWRKRHCRIVVRLFSANGSTWNRSNEENRRRKVTKSAMPRFSFDILPSTRCQNKFLETDWTNTYRIERNHYSAYVE